MAGLIDVMRCADFNRDIVAKLLVESVKARVSPALLAATFGLVSEVNSLLAEGVDASLRYGDNKRMSALIAAALMGHLDVVRALLEHGVDVNDVDAKGMTVLHTAVVHGRADLDLIDLLLSAGANINAATANGSTPLHMAACFLESGDAAANLLRRGAAKDSIASGAHQYSPLHVAAWRGNLSATRALLTAGADTTVHVDNAFKDTPLDFAAYFDQAEVVRELARHGVDLDAVDADGNTALHRAAYRNKAGVVDALVEAGASVTVQTLELGATALKCTVLSLALEAMRVLLGHGAPLDRGGELCSPLLHLAARKAGKVGASEAVDLLLRWGADESEIDDDGKTAAEVVGADQVPGNTLEEVDSGVHTEDSVMTDADRVRELLANAPADRVWRRRGLILLCLARDRLRRGRTRSGGKGKWKMKGKCVLTKDGGSGSGGGGGSAVSSRANAGVSTARTGRGKREKTLPKFDDRRTRSKVVDRRARPSGGGGSSNGCSGGGGAERAEKVGDFGGVVAMLLEFEGEGLFRTIVRYL